MVRPAHAGIGNKRKAGPLARGRSGRTVTARSQNNGRDDFEFRDDEDDGAGVLANVGIHVGLSKTLNNINSPKPHPTTKKKGSRGRKPQNSAGSRRKPQYSDQGPLSLALEYQGKGQQAPRLNSQDTFQGMVPRKGDARRNSGLSSLDGNTDGAHRSSHHNMNSRRSSASNNEAHPHDRPRPSTSRGRQPNTSHFFAKASTGVRRRSHAKEPEVLDLCGDDDDEQEHDPGNDTTNTEHSEDEGAAKSAASSDRKRKPHAKPSPASSSREKGSPATSSSSGTPSAESSATTKSTASSKDYDQDSSEEEELEVMPSDKKSRNSSSRAPSSGSSRGSSNAAYGSSDLYPGYGDESEQDDTGFSVCKTLDEISDEPYGGGTTPKKAAKTATKKTPAKRNKSTTPLSNFSWASSSANRSTSNEGTFGLSLTKANARNAPRRNAAKNRKTKGKPIKPGASIKAHSNWLEEDDILSCSSGDLSWGSTRNRRQNASYGGVEKNPYASSVPLRRKSHSRKAKTNARKPEVDLVDTDEEDGNTTLAASSRSKNPVRKKKDAIRIAIGKKVLVAQCAIQYKRTKTGVGAIVLSAVEGGKQVKHSIDLDDESVLETKYFVSKDDDDQAGATISIDFDESEQMTFLALKVKPNDENELSKYSNAYQPENSDGPDNRRYIAIEFRSYQEFLDLLRDLKQDDSLGAFVCDSTSQLNSAEAEVYGKSLFQAARKERADRESNVGSPRLRRKRRKKRGSKTSNEALLVFPFGADEEKIDKAAEVLTEASSTDAVACNEDIAAVGSATLKSADEEAMTSSSECADNDDEKGDDDKGESTGKAKSRAHFLTIRDEDYDRLQPGEFLNDTLIDFWFQWIWRKDRHVNGDVHFFTSHFYTALAKGGPEAVTSWTAKKNIDIFTKKYIFIPVNLSLHWSLCVVVNPGAILNEVEGYGSDCDETMDDELIPCILFFDSLKAHKKIAITNRVKKWLNSEWERLEKPKTENAEDAVNPFNKDTMKVYTPRVPYQDNSWDCGVFVCRYGYGLFRLREHSVTYRDRIDGFRALITDNEEFAFDRDDIVRIRRELATLLDNLSTLYKEWKKANDEAEKEAEEDSKKPAARQLLLEDDKVASTEVSESTTTTAVAEQAEGPSANAAGDGMSAESKETGFAKPSVPSPELAEAEMEAPTNESNDVEMGDEDSLSTQPEKTNADEIVDMDVDDESSEQKNAMDIETAGLAAGNVMSDEENADMQDEVTTAAFPIAPVKQEEDQYGDVEVSAHFLHHEDTGEAQREGQSDDMAASESIQVTNV